MKNEIKKFRKVKKTESYNGKNDKLTESFDSILILTAIPFIGTLLILLYFIARKTETHFEEIKNEKN